MSDNNNIQETTALEDLRDSIAYIQKQIIIANTTKDISAVRSALCNIDTECETIKAINALDEM